nr:restriction endonuclease subunit S [uncultured Desulfobulbus sp.]
MDAEYYRPELVMLAKCISTNPHVSIRRAGASIDCSAFYPSIVPYYDFKQNGVPFLRVNEIQNGLLSIDEKTAFLPEEILHVNRSTIATCEPGDLIIAKGGNSLGKVALLTSLYSKYSVCRDVLVVRTGNLSQINRFFLWLYLHSASGQSLLIRTASQTGQPHLTIESIARLKIPLIPNREQEKIERSYLAAEAAMEISRSAYTQAQQLLESELGLDKLRFDKPVGYTARFSELELSHRNDAQHYQPRFTRLLEHLVKFPSKRIRDIRRYNRRGIQPVYVDDGTHAVINSQHLGPKHINYDGLQKTTEHIFKASPEAHIQPDDLLIYTTGAYIGRTNVYLDEAPAFASNHVNILRLSPDIDHAYMAMVFQSIIGQFQTQKHARGSAQAELYPADIDKFVVPLLPPDKQQKIGNLVRESLMKQRESAQLLDQAKSRVEQLIEEAVQV